MFKSVGKPSNLNHLQFLPENDDKTYRSDDIVIKEVSQPTANNYRSLRSIKIGRG